MQRVQRLIYFSCINRNMITTFEYFIIDCHNHSISLLAGTIPVLIMCNLLSLKPFWCILSGQSIKTDLLYDYKHYSADAFPPSPAVSGAKQVSRSIFFPPKCRGKYNLNIEYFSTPWWKWISWLYECQQECLRETCGREMWQWPVLPFSFLSVSYFNLEIKNKFTSAHLYSQNKSSQLLVVMIYLAF